MINFGDLKRNYFSIKKETDEAVERVLSSGWFILGKELESFEKEFANYCGKKYGVGVGNGTQALELALKSFGIGNGDEVITIPNTSPFTVLGIIESGAKPVFVDVGEDYLIDVKKIEKAINEKTKAIIPVHLYGQACDMALIIEIAEKHNLIVIEDCCQAHGAEYNGKKVPVSDIGAFSFYPSKNLGAFGDAGIIVTNNEKINEKIRALRNGGQKIRDYVEFVGINSRLDEMQAAVLRVKLKYLDKWNEKRREIAKRYNEELKNFAEQPIENKNRKHVYHLYVVRNEKRDELKRYLAEMGIETGVHYSIPLHLEKAFSYLGYKEGDFPKTEKYAREILSLPMYPELTEEEIEKVIKTIREFNTK